MASAIEDEFVTCSICMNEYNEDTRKPKFLPCSHTVCFTCLQGIFRDNVIACPYCRQSSKFGGQSDVRKLPNNSHALHILKLNQQIADLTTLENTCDKYWCFTCGFMAKTECATSKHSTLYLAADTVNNLDAFVDLRAEFHSKKTKEKIKLTVGLEMRKDIQRHLNKLSQSVEAAKKQIEELQNENNLCMEEIVSKLDGLLQIIEKDPQNKTTELFLAEVASRLDDSTPEEMVDKLKVEFNKSLETCEQSLKETTSLSCQYEQWKKMKIAIKIFDLDGRQNTICPLLDQGFQLLTRNGSDGISQIKDPLVRQDLILLSHVVSSLMSRCELGKDDKKEAKNCSILWIKEISPIIEMEENIFRTTDTFSVLITSIKKN